MTELNLHEWSKCPNMYNCLQYKHIGKCSACCARYVAYINGVSDGVDYTLSEIKKSMKDGGKKNE